MARGTPLSRLVFRHYLRSALIPVLTIELLLLASYFAVNAWNTRRTEATLRTELARALPFLAESRATILDQSFARIASATLFFAREHGRLERDPTALRIEGPAPLLAKAPNGTLYQANRRDGSGLYLPLNAPRTPRQLEIAARSAALDPLYQYMVSSLPNVVAAYYNTRDNTNRLFPYIDSVWKQYPTTLQMTDFNFYYLADPRHNPARKEAWTGAYLDPAGQGWMVSCIAPVYLEDSLQGVVGLDLTIERIVQGLLGLHFPWGASAFLADDSGMILAMPPEIEAVLGLKELKGHVYNQAIRQEQLKPRDFSLFRNPDPQVAARFRAMYSGDDSLQVLRLKGEELFVIQRTVPQTGWRLFLVARSSEVFRSVQAASRRSHLIGGALVLLLLGFYVAFFLYLRRKAGAMSRQVATPIAQLAAATSRLGTEAGSPDLPLQGIEEIDRLTRNFNQLASELEIRSRELVASRVQAQVREKEGELAYARGLYESASGYLHNVGNLTTRLSSDLMDLQTLIRSTEQYPEVFRRLRTEEDPKLLDTFEEVLVERLVPRLKAATADIEDVRDCIHRTIAHQQSTFLDSRDTLVPTPVGLSELLERVGQEFRARAAAAEVELRWEIEPGIELRSHREPLYHGLVNLVKNSLEAIDGPGRIHASLRRVAPGRSVLVLSDTGCGLSPDELRRVLTAGYTTKPSGHGLGLHSFSVFLASQGFPLRIESPGKGMGCTMTIEFPHG